MITLSENITASRRARFDRRRERAKAGEWEKSIRNAPVISTESVRTTKTGLLRGKEEKTESQRRFALTLVRCGSRGREGSKFPATERERCAVEERASSVHSADGKTVIGRRFACGVCNSVERRRRVQRFRFCFMFDAARAVCANSCHSVLYMLNSSQCILSRAPTGVCVRASVCVTVFRSHFPFELISLFQLLFCARQTERIERDKSQPIVRVACYLLFLFLFSPSLRFTLFTFRQRSRKLKNSTEFFVLGRRMPD